ncbi:GDSL-type esterase/lipase family protein [Actinomycetospora sp. TBRC 11914]|uniref:GDSL-type esterase/lipase family protein n=1 Tax=Actinomycetospora sp. TBRC 11914 TaxID=2729387 RepID=UPI00145F2FBA|nr:GDSL-type esterase/lipase family protein [Actinomycetospora sp. TBRC 11914]NMO91370.1 hypothetical protein [Actinomycetospora sp. TBRC 11914]
MRRSRRAAVVALCLTVTAVTLTALTVTAVSRTADAAPRADGPVTFVALGDSWAAGTAAGGDPLVDPTGADGTSCRRTTTSYPARVGPRLAPQAWTSRACASTTGGANTQFAALAPGVTRVAITVGADATGLGQLVGACATGSTPAACEAAAARTGHALDSLGGALDASLADIHRRAPAARLVVTTYPRLSEGLPCAAGAADATAARRVDAAVARLDGILTDRGRAAGAVVVDARPAFVAHSACARQPWITPFAGPDPLRAGAPNADGQAALARLVAAALEPAPAPAAHQAATRSAPTPSAPTPSTPGPSTPGQSTPGPSAAQRSALGRLLAPLFGA